MPNIIDRVGKVFGRLTVLSFADIKNNKTYWHCMCSCGKEHITSASQLTTGRSLSCGCLKAELAKKRRTTHGRSGTSEHKVWLNMRRRCTDEKLKAYRYYGGRGIKVCEEWEHSFEDFLAHIGPMPTPKHQLDRIDNNGNYEPGNVRWVTRQENCLNRRSNCFVTHNGETLSVKQWATRLGVNYCTFRKRLLLGWDFDKAAYTPSRNKNPRKSSSRILG